MTTPSSPAPSGRRWLAPAASANWRLAASQTGAWRLHKQGRFSVAPERYAPQYGGHCAWAAAQNYVAPGDPRHWRIAGGKLYVNYDAKVQTPGSGTSPATSRRATRTGPGLLAKN